MVSHARADGCTRALGAAGLRGAGAPAPAGRGAAIARRCGLSSPGGLRDTTAPGRVALDARSRGCPARWTHGVRGGASPGWELCRRREGVSRGRPGRLDAARERGGPDAATGGPPGRADGPRHLRGQAPGTPAAGAPPPTARRSAFAASSTGACTSSWPAPTARSPPPWTGCTRRSWRSTTPSPRSAGSAATRRRAATLARPLRMRARRAPRARSALCW